MRRYNSLPEKANLSQSHAVASDGAGGSEVIVGDGDADGIRRLEQLPKSNACEPAPVRTCVSETASPQVVPLSVENSICITFASLLFAVVPVT